MKETTKRSQSIEVPTTIESAINTVLDAFQEKRLHKAIVYSMFPTVKCPSENWSITNRIIMYLVGDTFDARTFLQWKSVGRTIIKGRKSFPIIAPITFNKRNEDNETDEDDVQRILKGFRALRVFRYEDTDGKELIQEGVQLPQIPLMKVCEYLGIKVKAIPGNSSVFGYYDDNTNTIGLATGQKEVLYHELAHNVDYTLRSLKPCSGQQIDREIIAEMSACVLAFLIDKDIPITIQNHYNYLERYARYDNKSVFQVVNQYFKEIEKVITEIVRLSKLVNEYDLLDVSRADFVNRCLSQN